MSKHQTPFGDFDLSKLMGDLAPGAPDVERLMEAQKKNLEAIAEANRRAAESFQAIVQRQTDLMREAMSEAASAVGDLSASASPEARAQKQADLMRRAFERTITNMREIAEMAAQSNGEIYDLLAQRAAESLAEVKDMTAAPKTKGPRAKS